MQILLALSSYQLTMAFQIKIGIEQLQDGHYQFEFGLNQFKKLN